ncbi:MAG: LysR family transcriptional regulator [Myxococcales bacterium]|nr:LysR family transcriptional regulator [Myxococcales bacterium]
MDLNALQVFAKVVEAGSFVAAARDLDMPTSTVSRKVAELEASLGARLLHRTTRKLNLTEAGQAFQQHAARVVAEAEAAALAVGRMQAAPRGLLRVTAPLSFGFLGPVIASFLQRHPDVQVELVCSDRVVDLVEDGFDLAIRAGRLADSTLIARSLGMLRSYLVASPAFLERHGAPEAPKDLERYACVVFGGAATRAWVLSQGAKTRKVDVKGRLVVNDFDFIDDAVLSGLGIAMVPAFRCIEHLRAKRLVRVLPQWCSPEIPLHAVYPSTRYLSPKVTAFIEHLRAHMTPPPWERGPAPEGRRPARRR